MRHAKTASQRLSEFANAFGSALWRKKWEGCDMRQFDRGKMSEQRKELMAGVDQKIRLSLAEGKIRAEILLDVRHLLEEAKTSKLSKSDEFFLTKLNRARKIGGLTNFRISNHFWREKPALNWYSSSADVPFEHLYRRQRVPKNWNDFRFQSLKNVCIKELDFLRGLRCGTEVVFIRNPQTAQTNALSPQFDLSSSRSRYASQELYLWSEVAAVVWREIVFMSDIVIDSSFKNAILERVQQYAIKRGYLTAKDLENGKQARFADYLLAEVYRQIKERDRTSSIVPPRKEKFSKPA